MEGLQVFLAREAQPPSEGDVHDKLKFDQTHKVQVPIPHGFRAKADIQKSSGFREIP